ncbi:MAG: hypothetical protein ABEI86_07230, partial [Halobacteriaceae archaeon]
MFALGAAVGFIALEQTHHYAAYFIPEAFAVIFTIYILYLIYRAPQMTTYQQAGLWSLIGGALILTHHLTVFFF